MLTARLAPQRTGDVPVEGRLRLGSEVLLLLAFVGVSGLNYGYSIAGGWLLTPARFGVLAFTMSVGLVAGMVLHLGVPTSLAAALAQADADERAALVRGASVLNVGIGCVIGLVLMLLFGVGALRPGMESWGVASCLAASLPFVGFIAVVFATGQGLGRFGVSASVQLIEVIARMVIGVILMLLGAATTGALGGVVAGAAIASAMGLVQVVRRLGNASLRGPVQLPSLTLAGGVFAAQLGLVLLLVLDLLALKLLTRDGSGRAGFYQAALVLTNAPYYLVVSAMVPVLFTRVARLGDLSEVRAVLIDAGRRVALVVLPLELALLVGPEEALTMFFPGEYAAAAEPLRLLAVGNTLLVGCAILSSVFQAVGRARTAAVVLLGLASLEPLVLVPAIQRWGMTGAAMVFTGAATTGFALLRVTYGRAIGSRPRSPSSWTRRFLGAFLGSAAAGTAGLVATGSIYVAWALQAMAYGGLIVALRLLDVRECAVATKPPTGPRQN